MSSKKEDEKNEKIIRGLLKLPPNRRCINCNSLGPQYVCTNFWTFVCLTCSGIHREFTHRVKSVSMAKFTKQEVGALESGGNQRARELYLKEWDMQRMKLPDSNNAEKIREFIKDVYVNRKYEGKSPSKLPTDAENHEDIRRASSYHSFSQSPPYDYQYEDRRYGKQFGMLTRHPGSDRRQYLTKTTSGLYSPGNQYGLVYDDKSANGTSSSRMSDFSVSNAGDQIRYAVHSPNSQGSEYGSARVSQSKDIPAENVKSQMPNRCAVRSVSSSGFATDASRDDIFKLHTTQQIKFASTSQNLLSASNTDPASAKIFEKKLSTVSFGQAASTNLFEEKMSSVSFPQNEGWAKFDMPKLFSSDTTDNTKASMFVAPGTKEHIGNVGMLVLKQSDIDASTSQDLFSGSNDDPPSTNIFEKKSSTISFGQASSRNLFEKEKSLVSFPQNEGWATFDMPKQFSSSGTNTTRASVSMVPGTEEQIRNVAVLVPKQSAIDTTANPGTSAAVLSGNIPTMGNNGLFTQNYWDLFASQNDGPGGTLPVMHDHLQVGLVEDNKLLQEDISQLWNAFDGSSVIATHAPILSVPQSTALQFPVSEPTFNEQYNLSEEAFNVSAINNTAGGSIFSNDAVIGGPSTSVLFQPAMSSFAPAKKSLNPFDLSYDSDSTINSSLPDMNSLQAALPNPKSPHGDYQPWFPQNSMQTFHPSLVEGQASLHYMAGQVPNAPLPNALPHSHIASVGGNPFA